MMPPVHPSPITNRQNQPDLLARILAAKQHEITQRKAALPLAHIQKQLKNRKPAKDFAHALKGSRPRSSPPHTIRIIAELKQKSPSKGQFQWHGNASKQIASYVQGGAHAISVVTDAPFFGGSPELLQEVRSCCPLPLLQKDFLIDPWQVFYARWLGADACLLIAAALTSNLGTMLQTAADVGIHALVEITNEQELAQAQAAGAALIGINNRNLHTFQVDTQRTLKLLPHYQEQDICIAESGLNSPQQLNQLSQAGVDAFLIGEALMQSPNPAALLQKLLQKPAAPQQ